ncbi:MAG: HAD family hydrolase [Pseudomonadota bacterium]
MTAFDPIRIAMWSGPRNLSTAMMRSFSARGDTVCVDEPFYAAYLALTGLEHPMRAEILAAQPTDPHEVARAMSADKASQPIVYQKQMTHHMVDGVPRDWMAGLRHAFLIRHPARVLASFAKKMEEVSLAAIGFVQQKELYDLASTLGDRAPVIVDAENIRRDPERELTRLCAGLGIEFAPSMLSWTRGPKPEDGVWAPHWYDAVNASTGFTPPSDDIPDLPSAYQSILEPALEIYNEFVQRMREQV